MSCSFDEKVYEVVRRIPYGCVTTYGQIGAVLGDKFLARAVGNALHRNPDGAKTPCYKVLNSRGELAKAFVFGGAEEQARRLQSEGIEVRNGRVDLAKYGWRPEASAYELEKRLGG